MAGFTNRGKMRMLKGWFQALSTPTNFLIALVTSAVAPIASTNTLSELTQIASGNGYTTNGISLNRNATDFVSLTEDDSADRAYIRLKDIVWTASGGSMPSSGSGARYAVITDDNVTPASRDVLQYFDLAADRTISVGQTLTLSAAEFRLNET